MSDEILIAEGLVDKVGDDFLDYLKEEELISESFRKKINAQVAIMESSIDDNDSIIIERFDPNRPDGLVLKAGDVEQFVSFDTIETVWKDPDTYRTSQQVWSGFGFSPSVVHTISQDTLGRKTSRVQADYNKNSGRNPISGFSGRRSAYAKGASTDQGDGPTPPTRSNIHPGNINRRNRTTRVLQNVNASELLEGEFYSNRTRIPRQRWAGWLRLWDRRKTSVAPNKRSLIGKEWNKFFLMGYQLEKDLLFEIWYNTLDGSFSIHDKNGVELGRPVQTLQEAMKYFVSQITTHSSNDAQVLTQGGLRNQVASSLLRGMSDELSNDSAEANRTSQLASLEKKRMKQDAKTVKQFRKEQVVRKLRREERVTAFNDMVQSAARISTGLAKSAYKKMFDATSDPRARAAIGLRMAFEAAKEKATEEKDLNRHMFSEAKKILKDTFESEADLISLVNSYIKDPSVRAEVHKKFVQGDEEDQERRRQEIRDRLKSADAKFRDELEKKVKAQEEDTRRAQEKSEKRAKKSLGDKFDILAKKQKKYNKEVIGMKDDPNDVHDDVRDKQLKLFGINEAIDTDVDQESLMNEFEKEINNQATDSHVQSLRKMAENSPFTQAALFGQASSLISTYNETRAPKEFGRSRFAKWVKEKSWLGRGRGRAAKVILPTDPAPVWDQVKQKLVGSKARSDFIIGFTLGDKVNIEIWYETVPNPDYLKGQSNQPMISSFTVYDVSSKQVLRKFVPYYRNALAIALSKIGLV